VLLQGVSEYVSCLKDVLSLRSGKEAALKKALRLQELRITIKSQQGISNCCKLRATMRHNSNDFLREHSHIPYQVLPM
jgi:hypothetical protein